MEPLLGLACVGSGLCCLLTLVVVAVILVVRSMAKRPAAAGEVAGIAPAPRTGQVVSASMTRLEDVEDGEGATMVMGRSPPPPSAGSPAGRVPGLGGSPGSGNGPK